MELLTTSIGLIIWTVISFISLVVIAYAIYHLANNQSISPSQKLLWLIFIIFVPIFGAIIYLGTTKRTKKARTMV
jgi:uncharacterized membrane protein YoaK (UPF0700 family)